MFFFISINHCGKDSRENATCGQGIFIKVAGQKTLFCIVSVDMQQLTCPHCNKVIEISEALQKEVSSQMEKKFQEDLLSATRLVKEKTEKEIAEKMEIQVKDLENEKKQKEERIEKLVSDLLKANELTRDLKQKDSERELELQKKLSEERDKFTEDITKQVSEKAKLKEAELSKKLEDTQKALEEARKKSEQGSQQLQGEVLELALESMLKNAYPMDEIEPVGKGVTGADIRHIVKSQGGAVCGVILWEIKRTKHWEDKWLTKLKDDLRQEGANIPVIVSSELPKEAKDGMGLKENVWICSQALVLPLAELLRKNLYDVAKQKHLMNRQTEKSDLLFSYITGHEFQQQVESILEVYKQMQEQISKEKAVLTKSWKQREEQVEKILITTASIVGSMQGKIGKSSLSIKGLELLSLDDGIE